MGSPAVKWAWTLLSLLVVMWWVWSMSLQESSGPSKAEGEVPSGLVHGSPVQSEDGKIQEGSSTEPAISETAKSSHVEVSSKPEGPRGEYRAPPAGMVEFQVAEKDIVVGFGDIVLGRLPDDTKAPKGITPAAKSRLWPSARVPFQIQSGLSLESVSAVHQAIAYFREYTPVRFENATNQDADLIVFVPSETLCGSYLGKMGGAQPIYVSKDCGRQEVIHELMHALGFVHEQSREDRDQFIEIIWSAIEPDYWPQFGVVPEEWMHEYRGSVFDFDYESAMLYGPKAFVRSADLVSIKSRGFKELKPTESGLSRRDLERLYYLYGR